MKKRNLVIYIGIACMALAITATTIAVTKQRNEYARHDNIIQQDKEPVQEAKNDPVPLPETDVLTNPDDPLEVGQDSTEDPDDADHAEGTDTAEEVTEDKKEDKKEDPQVKEASVTQYNFHSSSSLDWPVEGNVIINFNMEHMTYFATLNEYRYSPAIAIQAEEGTDVKAAAAGQVVKIENKPDTGLTVTMMIGPEYEITYGQLKDCTLKEGDHVKRGELIGKISKVTGYYALEGDHLYLMLTRDGNYENPLSYLAFSE